MSKTSTGSRRGSTIQTPLRLSLAVAGVFLIVSLGASAAVAGGPNTGFGFHAGDVAGFPTGEVVLTGGGAFNSSTGFVHSGGGFTCTSDVNQGFLAGCLAGQGVRWDTAALLSSTTFKCTGSATETLKPATTDDDTVVLQADFYRAGDGNDESFSAQMIVSASDIADTSRVCRTSGCKAWVAGRRWCTSALDATRYLVHRSGN